MSITEEEAMKLSAEFKDKLRAAIDAKSLPLDNRDLHFILFLLDYVLVDHVV